MTETRSRRAAVQVLATSRMLLSGLPEAPRIGTIRLPLQRERLVQDKLLTPP